MSETSVQDEAARLLASRLADMEWFCSDEYDPDEPDDEHGDVFDYGLSWEKYLTNHRDGTVTYVHVLSTGGPHDEFEVTFGRTSGGWLRVGEVTWVFKPWFDRLETPLSDIHLELAQDFYGRFFADVLDLESE